MSIEVINEALELLRIAQSGMGPDPGYLDRYDRHHWNRISKCREGLEKLKQQEPVAHATEDGERVVTEKTYSGARHDGGATWSSMRPFSVPLYAAPVPAAVPDGVVKDAERYRWLRDRLAIEDIDRLVSEFFGTPDEAESVKTDAAIDAAMQKGGE